MTDLVKSQLARDHVMDEMLIAHILKECMEVISTTIQYNMDCIWYLST